MPNRQLFILAFLEGLCVVLLELFGTKLIVSTFGNTLYVWTSGIGVTMSSLMLGYFLGGWLSDSKHRSVIIHLVFTFVLCWLVLTPYLSRYFSSVFLFEESFYISSILVSACLLGLPLILLGTIPALLISLGSKKNAGSFAGKVFFLSTAGGICSAIFIGFLLFPKLGSTITFVIISIALLLVVGIIFFPFLKNKSLLLLPIILPVLVYSYNQRELKNPDVIYTSEGLGGVLKIHVKKSDAGPPDYVLSVNSVPQTVCRIFANRNNNQSRFWYTHYEAALTSSKPRGSRALLIGLGGGSVARELIKMGHKLDVVEIDSRMFEISDKYFSVDTSLFNDFSVDDGRHFIKSKALEKDKYDIVVIDVAVGEVAPNNIFTVEGLRDLKKILAPDAIIVANFESDFDNPDLPVMNLLKTFVVAGYDCKFNNPGPYKPADYIFFASPSRLPLDLFNLNNMNDCCVDNPFVRKYQNTNSFISYLDLTKIPNAKEYYDDKPLLEIHNITSSIGWRKNYIFNQ